MLKVHGDHQFTVEDEKKIDEEIEELERKIKAVSSEKLQLLRLEQPPPNSTGRDREDINSHQPAPMGGR